MIDKQEDGSIQKTRLDPVVCATAEWSKPAGMACHFVRMLYACDMRPGC